MSNPNEPTPRELSVQDIVGKFSPGMVGFARGIIGAMLMAGLTYITTQLSDTASGAGVVGGVASVGLVVFRAVEGILDGKLLGAPKSPRLLGGRPRAR